MAVRNPPLTLAEIHARLHVDCETGRCTWKDPGKHHPRLLGTEAGAPRKASHGGEYWVIKFNGLPYKRAQIVLMVATGRWPDDVVDHRNGNKLDDRSENLRHATVMQNNQNHKRRAKRASTPMGVRQLPSGRFQARIASENGAARAIGTFDTEAAASSAYHSTRKELFGDYA